MRRNKYDSGVSGDNSILIVLVENFTFKNLLHILHVENMYTRALSAIKMIYTRCTYHPLDIKNQVLCLERSEDSKGHTAICSATYFN